jgi:hypothetical protein
MSAADKPDETAKVVASESAYSAWLKTMPDAYVECRSWRRHDLTDDNQMFAVGDNHLLQIVTCRRCGYSENRLLDSLDMSRVSTFNRSYPTDYQKPAAARLAAPGQIPIAEFRGRRTRIYKRVPAEHRAAYDQLRKRQGW